MDQIRILRESRGWTQQHLADASGLSLRTIQRIEAREVEPSKETLLALSGAFNVVLNSDEGPHVVLKYEDDSFLPGCRINVVKDNYQVPCVVGIDSRARTATRFGMLLLDFPDIDERNLTIENFEAPTDWGHPVAEATKIYIDGKLWSGRDPENQVTIVYDAVLLCGPHEVIYGAAAEGKLPKHWVLIPTDPTSTPKQDVVD